MTIRPGKKYSGIIEALELEAERHNWSLNKFVLISLSKIITFNEQQNARQTSGGTTSGESTQI